MAPALHGQADPAPVAADGSAHERGIVVVDSTIATVGFALHVPIGDATDPSGSASRTHLVAVTLQQVLRERTAGLASHLRVDAGPGTVVISAQATVDAFPDLIHTVQQAAFETPLGTAQLERHRNAIVARMSFESGAPVRAFERAATRAIFSEFPEWSRALSGTYESVGQLPADEIGATPPFPTESRLQATAAVVGPLVAARAESWLDQLLLSSPSNPAPNPAPTVSGHAWSSGDMRKIPADITRTWVAVALPLRSDLPRWKQHLLALHVRETLTLRSTNTEVLSPRVTLREPEGYPVLFIAFATLAEEAEPLAERVIATARLEVDAPADDGFFEWTRRRFRTAWLSAQTSPEARARRLVTDPGASQKTASPRPIGTMPTRADLQEGALALGQPRVVVYGPTLEMPEEP